MSPPSARRWRHPRTPPPLHPRIGSDYEARVRAIEWSEYVTAYGPASERGPASVVNDPGTIADELVRLASADRDEALRASHNLWCALCHQHVQVGSAALPALPFILEVLDGADGAQAVELLDILVGFGLGVRDATGGWRAALRDGLRGELHRWHRLSQGTDEEISAFARILVETLEP